MMPACLSGAHDEIKKLHGAFFFRPRVTLFKAAPRQPLFVNASASAA
jgi:hypothetical protein